MIAYPDTSFLCSIYRWQVHHDTAVAYRRQMSEPLHYTSLLEFEFLQSIRLQVWLHASEPAKGFAQNQADQMIADWEADVAAGVVRQAAYDAEAVNRLARTYSGLYTARGGNRTLDVLHVATAVHLGAKEFLTFDRRQKKLAELIGLNVPV